MPYLEISGIPVFGEPQDNAVGQIVNCAKDAEHAALMADHHLGYAVPIGGVVAYEGRVSPSGVGFDIACGNKAVLLDADASEVRENISTLMDDVWRTLSFGIGRKNDEDVDHELFHDDPAWDLPAAARIKDKARAQLGTIGSGNHYVDLFTDERDRVWVGVHFGSRGLGHGLATHYIQAGGGKDGIHADPVLLDTGTDLGREYVAAMELAGRYAYAGRDWVCDRVARLLGAHVLEEVHNHHNFAWEEEHDGRTLWVVRKGATPAFPGQKGFVGGSMGDVSVILEGVDSDESRTALYSTVHGAGRVMSRTAAAGKSRRRWTCANRDCDWSQPPKTHRPDRCPRCGNGKLVKRWVQVKQGAVSREMMMDWVHGVGVELRGAGLDESPHCYKRLPEVLEYHEPTVRVLHTLTPIGVAMAGPDEFDPFKD
jgi:tRNA-splicing ligase RtcB (3'-phosphate/5'-hydroxy nucleic acid ligase)